MGNSVFSKKGIKIDAFSLEKRILLAIATIVVAVAAFTAIAYLNNHYAR